MQFDKLILSKIISLDVFAYYTLARNSLSQIPSTVCSAPIHQALFPRLSQLIAQGKAEQLTRTYHLASQLAAIFVLPAALILFRFPEQCAFVWLDNSNQAEQMAPLLRLLVIGGALSGICFLPHCLLMAHGDVTFALKINLIFLSLVGPMTGLLALKFGARGGCFSWALLNTGYLIAYIPGVHRRIFPRENFRWFLKCVAKPFGGAIAPLICAFPFVLNLQGRFILLGGLAIAWLLSSLGAIFASDDIRCQLKQRWLLARGCVVCV